MEQLHYIRNMSEPTGKVPLIVPLKASPELFHSTKAINGWTLIGFVMLEATHDG